MYTRNKSYLNFNQFIHAIKIILNKYNQFKNYN